MKSKLTPTDTVNLRRDTYRAMRALLGDGFMPGYYESAASEFLQIAESFAIEYANRRARQRSAAKARATLQSRASKAAKARWAKGKGEK